MKMWISNSTLQQYVSLDTQLYTKENFMKKVLTLILILISLTVQAEEQNGDLILLLNLSVAEKCKEQNDKLVFQTTLPVPPEFRFLAASEPKLIPMAIYYSNKGEILGGGGTPSNTVSLVTEAGQFFSVLSDKKIKIYIETSKEILCDPRSKISFTMDFLNDSESRYSLVKYVISPEENLPMFTAESRKDLLQLINTQYANDFIYYLSSSFPWRNISNNTALVDFFYNINPQYLLKDNEILQVLNNPLFQVESVENGNLRINFGSSNYLEFSTQQVWLSPTKFQIYKIKTNDKVTFSLEPKPAPPKNDFPNLPTDLSFPQLK